MNKVKTLDDLRKMRETLRSTLDIREKSNHPEQMVQVRVSMATCGIAAGAKEIMNYFIEALDRESRCFGDTNRVHGILLCRTDCRSYPAGQRTSCFRTCEESEGG